MRNLAPSYPSYPTTLAAGANVSGMLMTVNARWDANNKLWLKDEVGFAAASYLFASPVLGSVDTEIDPADAGACIGISMQKADSGSSGWAQNQWSSPITGTTNDTAHSLYTWRGDVRSIPVHEAVIAGHLAVHLSNRYLAPLAVPEKSTLYGRNIPKAFATIARVGTTIQIIGTHSHNIDSTAFSTVWSAPGTDRNQAYLEITLLAPLVSSNGTCIAMMQNHTHFVTSGEFNIRSCNMPTANTIRIYAWDGEEQFWANFGEDEWRLSIVVFGDDPV